MQQKRKLLFITWDGPQTSYMEGLFMPIFEKVATLTNVEFHVIQFTWATVDRTSKIAAIAAQMGVKYNTFSIKRSPHPLVGTVITVFKGVSAIKKYIKLHHIDMVMPRSTFPAMMVNMISNKNLKLIFDADGLPLEERIDFGSLTTASRQYRFLKKQETRMLKVADSVTTRSEKAIDIHVANIGEQYRSKFSVVFNGRDEDMFKPDTATRDKWREQLGFLPAEKVFLYCGSLGKQYGWDEMLTVFSNYAKAKPAHWLVLTGDIDYAAQRIPQYLKDKITLVTSAIADVPGYLTTADVAFAIREPLFSMQGVAPIKLGEYLLMGLPTIASGGIGDTDTILKKIPGCFIFDHAVGPEVFKQIAIWLDSGQADTLAIREAALRFFSLNAAATSYLNAITSNTI